MATVATLRDLVDALIETGLDGNNLETIISDLKTFFEIISESEELKNVLATAAFEIEEKNEVISDLCQNSGLNNEIKNFLVLASEFDKFGLLLNTKDVVIGKLEQAAGRLNRATGKEVEISVSIDPMIIGGLITKIGDKVFDNSIKTQLEKIQGVLNP